MDITELEEYFPDVNKAIICEPFTFSIILQNSTENEFIINLKIKQKDTKKDHHIKFKFGIGKDKESDSITHKSHKPHFEIDLSKRESETFAARLYITFEKVDDKELIKYCKGTIVIIDKILKQFFEKHNLNKSKLNDLIYEEEVVDELSEFEPILIKALSKCYQNSELVLRNNSEIKVIKTIHNLNKYLEVYELKPLFLPLEKEIKNK